MSQDRLMDSIHAYYYTRKIDFRTRKAYMESSKLDELLHIAKEENTKLLNRIAHTDSQYFHLLNYADGYASDLKQNIKMISCLFPKRLIITSFMKQGTLDALLLTAYNDFERFYRAGIMELYVELEERAPDWSPEKNQNTLPKTMKSSNILLLTHSHSELDYESIRIVLPWLYNARPGDYLDLIQKYDLQFEIYCQQIDRICKTAKTPEELTQLFVSEVKDAFIDIRIALEKKKEELKRKGISTTIGAIATAIPLLIPSSMGNISPELLSGLLGATNVLTTLPPMIGSIHDLLQCERYNKYWLLWKWNKISI